MDIRSLVKTAHENALSKGFWDGTAALIPVKLALIMSEGAEALEAHRKEYGREQFAEELADIVIRVADLAGGLDIDLQAAIEKKVAKNSDRPHLHEVKY